MKVPIAVRRTLLPLALLLAAALAPQPAQAATAVTVELRPAEVTLEPGAARSVTAVITNGGDTAVNVTRLIWRTESFVSIDPAEAAGFSLAVGGAAQREFTVTVAESAVRETTIVLIAEFDVAGVAGIATGNLAVKLAPTVTPPAQAATMTSAVGTLSQHRSTDIVVTATNSSTTRRVVTEMTLIAPGFVDISHAGDRARKAGRSVIPVNKSLAPGEKTAIVATIEVTRPLQPGKATLLAEVTSRPEPGSTTSTAVTTLDISFEVLGESAVLEVLGVPSLLLVPGLVFAVVLWLLRKRVYPRSTPAAEQPASITEKVMFWVLALPVSLVLCFTYKPLTTLINQPRDILTSYGLDDILYIWLMGAGAALILWLLFWMLPMGTKRAWRALFVPAPGDDPQTLLNKLGRRPVWLSVLRDMSLSRKRCTWTPDGKRGQSVCLLRSNRSQSLISSPILYRPITPQIDTLIQEDNAYEIAKALRNAGLTVHIDYRDLKPTLVDNSTLTFRGKLVEASIVEQP